MEEQRKRMGLRHSSVLTTTDCTQFPQREWLALTTSTPEYFRLAHTLSLFPVGWLAWTERTARRLSRGRANIRNPLGFRMSILWNGVVLLQEAKFLCDVLENGLRVAVRRHCEMRGIALKYVYSTAWEGYRKRLRKDRSFELNFDRPIPELLLSSLTFGHLIDLISGNWFRIPPSPRYQFGFACIFWENIAFRDKNLFGRDMRKIKDARDKIAHSSKLLHEAEVRELYSLVHKWLEVIDVGADPRIARYRKVRPDFLTEVVAARRTKSPMFD